MTPYQRHCQEWVFLAQRSGYFPNAVDAAISEFGTPDKTQSDIVCCNLMNDIWCNLPDNRSIHGMLFDRLCDLCVIDEDYDEGEDYVAF
jgi:hypothetical protein